MMLNLSTDTLRHRPTAHTSPGVPQPATSQVAHRHWKNGAALAKKRRWTEAALAFGRAAHAAPKDVLFWINLANAERNAGALTRAETAARRALELLPGEPLALQVLGDVLAQTHRYAESLEVFAQMQQGGALEPDAMVRQAGMLLALLRPQEALDVLWQALSRAPGHLKGHALMVDAFRDLGLKREAVECMKTVLALDPGNLEALSHLSYEKRHLCDWIGLQADTERIAEGLHALQAGEPRVCAAFGLLSLPLSPQEQLAASRADSNAVAWRLQRLPPLTADEMRVRRSRRPRLALASYDFREHPVAQLLVEVLERMDRSRFDVVLYSSGPDDGSALRRRLQAACAAFVDLRGLSDGQAAERVRADGIDIMSDLGGHTRGHRLGVLARRPAPVQVSFLGYVASTGADFIDYIVGDPLVTPLQLAHDYTEKIAQMPLTLQPNGRWRPLPRPMARAEAGLPEDAFVMCAFNHTYKILPEALDRWCAVMRDVPKAVLWLKETNGQLRDNVLREVAARGVSADRVIFARNVSYEDHFSRLALADVFVDTWPYCAQTTASDALWAGVPVVTLYGNGYQSRVAASVLNAAGLGELAFGDADDYQRAITALGLDASLAAGYKTALNEQRMSLPLFDSARYAGEFQDLMERMWARWCAGLAPEHLPA